MHDDDQEIGAELRRLASSDPLAPVSSSALLARGRRGRVRRRVVSSAGVAVAVAAVATTAALLPGFGGQQHQSVAGPPAPTSAGTQSPTTRGQGSQRVEPTADNATVLRACSVKLAWVKRLGGRWPTPVTTDLTGWNVLVRSTQPRVGTAFVATSPDGKLVAACTLYAPAVPSGYDNPQDAQARPVTPDPRAVSSHLFGAANQCGADLACAGYLYTGSDRVPTNVTRIKVQASNGRSLDVPVRGGWFAIMWADGGKARYGLDYTAYDASGKVVKPDPEVERKDILAPKEAWLKDHHLKTPR